MWKLLTAMQSNLFTRIHKPSNPVSPLVSSPPKLRKRRKKKRGDTWDLTEQRVRVFAKGRCHRGVHSRLPITRRQFWSSVVPALIIVVLYIQVDKLGVVYTERTASIVYVLTIECLRDNTRITYILNTLYSTVQTWALRAHFAINRSNTHHFGLLSTRCIIVL